MAHTVQPSSHCLRQDASPLHGRQAIAFFSSTHTPGLHHQLNLEPRLRPKEGGRARLRQACLSTHYTSFSTVRTQQSSCVLYGCAIAPAWPPAVSCLHKACLAVNH